MLLLPCGVQPLADDAGDAVAVHRHTIEDVSHIHRRLLVRDDNELTRCPQLLKQRNETTKVHIIEG